MRKLKEVFARRFMRWAHILKCLSLKNKEGWHIFFQFSFRHCWFLGSIIFLQIRKFSKVSVRFRQLFQVCPSIFEKIKIVYGWWWVEFAGSKNSFWFRISSLFIPHFSYSVEKLSFSISPFFFKNMTFQKRGQKVKKCFLICPMVLFSESHEDYPKRYAPPLC